MSTTTSTATTSPLRRRLFTHDKSSARSMSPESGFSVSPVSQQQELSESDSSADEDAPVIPNEQRKAPAGRAPLKRNLKQWYEFDRTVLLVLLSPVGSWLTGNGEWMRDLILVVLGVYYLHQIIEVPWNLYLASLPPSPSPSKSDNDEARRELRRIELFLLTCTVLSPFIGTVFLKYILRLVTGSSESLSWFSTSLFVLTCGIRPWKHLVDRIDGRVSLLQSSLHHNDHQEEELSDLRNRLEKMEKLLRKDAEEIYNYVDEAVESLETHARRNERKWEKQQARLTKAETSLANIVKENNNPKTSSTTSSLVSRFPGVSAFIPARPIRSSYTPPRTRVAPGKRQILETIPEETRGPRSVKPVTPLRQQSPIAVLLDALLSLVTMPFWPLVWVLAQVSSVLPGTRL